MKADEIITALRGYYQVYIFDDDVELYAKYMGELKRDDMVLDLGTGWGKSATALSLANPDVLIETIDFGNMQVEMGWAKDVDDYEKKVNELINSFVFNVNVIIGNCMDYLPKSGAMKPLPGWELSEDYQYDLIHMDMSKDSEQEVLKRWITYLKPGGIFLVRNYFRFAKEADEILKGFKYLENQGQIQVVRKP